MKQEAFWIVWSPAGKRPPSVYTNSRIADHDAERLDRATPGVDVFVLRAEKRFTKTPSVLVVELDAVEVEEGTSF